ncbi:MAG TPA: SH3 domain-containing protein [Pyrinomonadaceae bacterium]|nr:SH3 domain-containing protein [Pyrinomonadaceae bacterium]
MKEKFSITATLVLAMIFGTIVLPHSSSATTMTELTPTFQDNCVVKGDNDAPLRVRSTPNGKVIGSLKVGADILAYDLVKDKNGKYWTKIKYKKGFGYVSTQFISCG